MTFSLIILHSFFVTKFGAIFMDEEDPPAQQYPPYIEDNLAWNIALGNAKINLTSLEATIQIMKQKIDLNHLQKNYMAGTAAMIQNNDVVYVENWESKIAEKIELRQKEHESRMSAIISENETRMKELQNEIDMAQRRIDEANNSINTSRIILSKPIPEYDSTKIKEIELLKAKIEDAKKIINLTKKKNNRNQQGTDIKSISKVLETTTPPALKVISPNNKRHNS